LRIGQKPFTTNGDATLARDAVAGRQRPWPQLVDYMLRASGHSCERSSGFRFLLMMMGDLASSPKLEQAPSFIKDTLMFPYSFPD